MCLLLRALFKSFQYSTWGELESLISLTREVHQYMAFPWKLKVARDTFFLHSLDGTQKVVPLSFPNLVMPLHFPSHGNEEGQPKLL